MTKLRKRLRIITWVLSLIALTVSGVISIVIVVFSDGFSSYLWEYLLEIIAIISLPIGGFAGVWAVYGIIWAIYQLIARTDKASYIVLWLGVISIALMCFFPPWYNVYRDGNVKIIRPVGYHCFLSSLNGFYAEGGVGIDYKKLIMQCCIVAIIAGSGMYCFSQRLKRAGGEDE